MKKIFLIILLSINLFGQDDLAYDNALNGDTSETGNHFKYNNGKININFSTTIKVGVKNNQLILNNSNKKIIPSRWCKKGILLHSGFKLRWKDLEWSENPKSKEQKEVKIIKNNLRKPRNINDGELIYSGSNKGYLDKNYNNKNDTFYAFYSIDKNNELIDDCYFSKKKNTYTLHGRITDRYNKSLSSNSEIELRYKDGPSYIYKSINTNKDGSFVFNNLKSGKYSFNIINKKFNFKMGRLHLKGKRTTVFIKSKTLKLDWIGYHK